MTPGLIIGFASAKACAQELNIARSTAVYRKIELLNVLRLDSIDYYFFSTSVVTRQIRHLLRFQQRVNQHSCTVSSNELAKCREASAFSISTICKQKSTLLFETSFWRIQACVRVPLATVRYLFVSHHGIFLSRCTHLSFLRYHIGISTCWCRRGV